jgi:hypothetical protein
MKIRWRGALQNEKWQLEKPRQHDGGVSSAEPTGQEGDLRDQVPEVMSALQSFGNPCGIVGTPSSHWGVERHWQGRAKEECDMIRFARATQLLCWQEMDDVTELAEGHWFEGDCHNSSGGMGVLVMKWSTDTWKVDRTGVVGGMSWGEVKKSSVNHDPKAFPE